VSNFTQDIKYPSDWQNIIRSVQSRLSKSKNIGLAVTHLSIIFDDNGKPISWTEADVTKLEPWRRMQHLLDLLTAPYEKP
jgi:hypothetical protein